MTSLRCIHPNPVRRRITRRRRCRSSLPTQPIPGAELCEHPSLDKLPPSVEMQFPGTIKDAGRRLMTSRRELRVTSETGGQPVQITRRGTTQKLYPIT